MSKLLYRFVTYIIYLYFVNYLRLDGALFRLADNIAAYLEQNEKVSEEYVEYLLDKRNF